MADDIDATYTDALKRLDAVISEMIAGRFRHYREGPDGRLNVDDTERMIGVAEEERKLLVSFALLSH